MQATIIWLAMAITPVIYWGVLFFLINIQGFSPPGLAPESFRYLLIGLWAAAAVSAVVSYKIYGSVSGLNPRQEDYRSKRLNRMIIAWALAESIAVYGLVLALIRADTILYYPLGLASLIIIVCERPAREAPVGPRSPRSYPDEG